jgi:hypothetical protein
MYNLQNMAAVEEIMEVFELVSVLGIHTCAMGVPILMEEVKKFEEEKIKRSCSQDRIN